MPELDGSLNRHEAENLTTQRDELLARVDALTAAAGQAATAHAATVDDLTAKATARTADFTARLDDLAAKALEEKTALTARIDQLTGTAATLTANLTAARADTTEARKQTAAVIKERNELNDRLVAGVSAALKLADLLGRPEVHNRRKQELIAQRAKLDAELGELNGH